MNILFCGDRCMEDGLIITILSLLENTDDQLHIYVFTMGITTEAKQFFPLSEKTADYLDARVKEKDPENFVKLMDLTEMYKSELPWANLQTRFTPYCMLRLFADEIPEIPDRLLYLDSDVICRKDVREFYEQDLEGCEIAGVLDHYGRFFFRTRLFHMDYLNSGVLLLDMKKIRETGLFKECRAMCRNKKMFMPDQSALNKLAKGKKICKKKYNEQIKLHNNTVIQHFSTRFRYFPWVHTQTVKPWQIDSVHRVLKLFEYDDLLEKYKQAKTEIENL